MEFCSNRSHDAQDGVYCAVKTIGCEKTTWIIPWSIVDAVSRVGLICKKVS